MELEDKFAIAEVIQAWGVYRDQGKWDELRGTFTPDGHISVSWFRGPFEQFVEHCQANFAAGKYLVAPSSVRAERSSSIRIARLRKRRSSSACGRTSRAWRST